MIDNETDTLRYPMRSFEGVTIPRLPPSARWLQYSLYVKVPVKGISTERILNNLEQAFNTSKFETVVLRSFSSFICEFEVHFNAGGEHTDARCKIYICGDDYLIQADKRSGDGQIISQLFRELVDTLMDSVTVISKEGVVLDKNILRPRKEPHLTSFEDRRQVIDDSIKRAMELVQSPFVDLSYNGIISLIAVIQALANDRDLIIHNHVLEVLGGKLSTGDNDLKLSALTAIRCISEGGSVMHDAIIVQGTFFHILDAISKKSKITPFTEAPFYHGRMDKSGAEEIVGAMHPGSFIAYTDIDATENEATIVCLESLRGDGMSYHMKKIFSNETVLFDPDTKEYRLSDSSKAFSNLSTLVGSDGVKWTTPLMTSVVTLLIEREAIKILANICETKSVLDKVINKTNGIERVRDAYENENGDDVVRRVAYKVLKLA